MPEPPRRAPFTFFRERAEPLRLASLTEKSKWQGLWHTKTKKWSNEREGKIRENNKRKCASKWKL